MLELKYDVVLASKSPRRQQLLRDLGINFRVEVIEGIQESYPATMPADEVAQFLAIQKAKPYRLKDNELLITADTIVVLDGEVLGKPADAAEAHQMLRNLSGKVHHVITGVCVTTKERQESFADVTEVEFAELTDEEIDYYIEHYRPMDKAGAYGIQEWIGYMGVKRINGCFYNVMGLPVPRLYALLKSFGVHLTP
jgi:septum formation protein